MAGGCGVSAAGRASTGRCDMSPSSPKAGTPVMAASPLFALELPLKVLIWDDGDQTKLSYYAPAALAAKHHLSADLRATLSGITPLTDALGASERPVLSPVRG